MMAQVARMAIMFLACCVQLGAAGQAMFNKRFDSLGQLAGEGGISVEAQPNGEFIVVASSPWTDYALGWYYSSVVSILRLGNDGEVLGSSHFNIPGWASYPGWANSSDLMSDGKLIIGGSTYGEDGTTHAALFLVTPDGIPASHWEYGPNDEAWIGRQAKQAPDGGFVICGETSVNGPADAFVLKTDAQGNQEWVQTYGGQLIDFGNSVDLNGSQGFFLGGQYRVTMANKNLWVKRLDNVGDEVWNKVWGSPWDEPNAHLTTAADGNILIASAYGHGPNWTLRRYLAKLDKEDGSIIWERQYANIVYTNTFYVVQEVEPGGDLIAVGDDTSDDPVLGVMYKGCLLRTTSTGDSLWMRYYDYYDDNVSNGRGYFRDVQPTSDGGFIAVGQALQVPGVYTSDVWVVKTDGHGCIEPGCHLITGVETQITNLRGALFVAPNPVAHGAAVQVSIALPENFIPQGALRITVVSSDGRVAHELPLSGVAGPRELRGTKQEAISMSLLTALLPSGLYHLHLSDATRWISGAKLVVE